ncbi:DNA replication ATPase [Schizosaccharomyces japonicus yFS275]|uniref:DNA replication ATPase n=1 Tax=Schizosaccharomyces japonicus (strain yFS275 / FY16936) TaxID=402676 RepID=B6K1T7_SCHJY|nr:DNA replication ATPase [Schizosaccharomyces japonicus yFS275]EEB07118.2 DNA replication ATPase [Schizosaccharomyces japonicus yFS275]
MTENTNVACPVCNKSVQMQDINAHLDNHYASPSKFREKQKPSRSVQDVLYGKTNTHSVSSPKVRKVDETLPSEQTPKRIKSIKKDVRPLAERVRPKTLDDYVGQESLVGKGGIIRNLIERDECPSMILWGNSGVGKTTLARIIAKTTGAHFLEVSATSASVSDCRKIFEESQNLLRLTGKKTIVFLDEVHRFNRAQQDIFLPMVEKGLITLIGATTENPSFRLNSALLSRCSVFTFNVLDKDNVLSILRRAMQIESERKERKLELDESILQHISAICDGDARVALNCLEIALGMLEGGSVSLPDLKKKFARSFSVYDSTGDAHYDTISAFHKSIRGSDVDAALYYLCRMLESGEDPLYVARRMVRIASEDVGLGDNSLLPLASAAFTATQQIGMPEADVVLAHCAAALALAPKNVDVYRAYKRVKSFVASDPEAGRAQIPMHLRNAPTKLMKELGYNKGYKYNPDYKDGRVKQDYLPKPMKDKRFFRIPMDLPVDPDLDADESSVTELQEERRTEKRNDN